MINSPRFSNEEEIAKLVRSTLQSASQTNNLKLKQLMPEIPKQSRQRSIFLNWPRQFAVICTAVVLCLGLYGFYQSNQQPAWQPTDPTSIAITATFTSEPTVTESNEHIAVTETAVAVETQSAENITPAPKATPVAALILSNLPTPNN